MCATITDETQCEAYFTPQRTTMAAAQTHHGQHRYTYRTCGRGQSEAGRFPGPRPEIHSFPLGGPSRRQTTRGLAGGVMPAPVYSPAVGRARLGGRRRSRLYDDGGRAENYRVIVYNRALGPR